MTTPTVSEAPETRNQARELLDDWISQPPGLDWREYGDWPDGWRAYRREAAAITKQRHDADDLLRQAFYEHRPYNPDALARAFQSAYSGRLSCVNGKLDYVTGQYWPTEYRQAAAAVLRAYLNATN